MAEDVRGAAISDNGVLKRASSENLHETVQPPDDFWQQMQAAIEKLKAVPDKRPPNTKTLSEITEGMHMSIGQARRTMDRLVKSGMYTKITSPGGKNYYRLADDDNSRDR